MFEITPSFEEFQRLAERGNLIPLTASVLADRDTPVTVFERVKHRRHAFLLESVEHGADSPQAGRYSFVGFDPRLVLEFRGGVVWGESADGERRQLPGRPLEVLRAEMRRFKPVKREGVPPFIGGAVGFLGYDIVREFERISDNNPNDLNLPEGLMMLAESVIAIDHVRRRVVLVANAFTGDGIDPRAAYDAGCKRLEDLRTLLRQARPAPGDTELFAPEMIEELPSPTPAHEVDVPRLKELFPQLGGVKSTVSEAEFQAMVLRAKEFILAGDAFQIVGSQRFHTRFDCDPFDIYRSLRDVNPSPYMYYLQFGGLRVAGSSPEILVKLQGRKVQLRPIAGTRRRGKDAEEDKALAADLLADAKERAEHVMLVDLGRNDVGRVCEAGSVCVDQIMVIERYSHVMHIVSNVTGTLSAENDAFDVLAASFPAGTVSGAPKIRAMEIIDELETVRRGAYAGTVCYFSFDGNLDSCITIRTAVLIGREAFVQAGGGWVADSDPAAEYQETVNKASAVLRAIAQAQAGLE